MLQLFTKGWGKLFLPLPPLFKVSSVMPHFPHHIVENLDTQYHQLFLVQLDPPLWSSTWACSPDLKL